MVHLVFDERRSVAFPSVSVVPLLCCCEQLLYTQPLGSCCAALVERCAQGRSLLYFSTTGFSNLMESASRTMAWL